MMATLTGKANISSPGPESQSLSKSYSIFFCSPSEVPTVLGYSLTFTRYCFTSKL